MLLRALNRVSHSLCLLNHTALCGYLAPTLRCLFYAMPAIIALHCTALHCSASPPPQAKKFLAERSPAYMTARTALREMRTYTDTLARPLLPRVPSWSDSSLAPGHAASAATVERERAQVDAWKKYIRWEESNPLMLEDVQALQARVLLAYKKATMHIRFFPEIW